MRTVSPSIIQISVGSIGSALAAVTRNSAAMLIRSGFICVCSPLGLRGALLLLLLPENGLHFLRRCLPRRETAEPIAVIAFPGLSIKLPSYSIPASSDHLPWSELCVLRIRCPCCQEQRSDTGKK